VLECLIESEQTTSVVRVLGVIGPHLDDAWLSCSQVIAANPGAEIVTVFAGGPTSVDPIPPWEAISDLFVAGDDVIRTRRLEDVESSLLVDATSRHLESWDAHYRNEAYGYRGPQGDQLTEAITDQLDELTRTSDVNIWVMPLGILHEDHKAAADACITLAIRGSADVEWRIYEDLPYWKEYPADRAAAHRRVADKGLSLVPITVELDKDLDKKRRLIGCHRSQLKALASGVEIAVRGPEQYYRLEQR
jgi:LmbE family N-acetylglucosaminyl deacetylase